MAATLPDDDFFRTHADTRAALKNDAHGPPWAPQIRPKSASFSFWKCWHRRRSREIRTWALTSARNYLFFTFFYRHALHTQKERSFHNKLANLTGVHEPLPHLIIIFCLYGIMFSSSFISLYFNKHYHDIPIHIYTSIWYIIAQHNRWNIISVINGSGGMRGAFE